MEREPHAWEYNLATLSLGDINTGTWPWRLDARLMTLLCEKITVMLHYIAFHGFRVSQNDCRMWNVSYKYKNICTVQLKFSHKKTQENTVVTYEAIKRYIHTCMYMNTVNLCYLPTVKGVSVCQIIEILIPM
jgi:hypothetical protein